MEAITVEGVPFSVIDIQHGTGRTKIVLETTDNMKFYSDEFTRWVSRAKNACGFAHLTISPTLGSPYPVDDEGHALTSTGSAKKEITKWRREVYLNSMPGA